MRIPRTPWSLGLTSCLPVSSSRCLNGTLTPALQVWEYRGAGHRPAWGRRDPRCLGKFCSGRCPRAPCLSFKNDYCVFFVKAPAFAKERGEIVPIETGQNLSGRGDPGFSLWKCVFAKFWVAVADRALKGLCPSPLPPTPVLAALLLPLFLEHSAGTQEPVPPVCVICGSGAHSLFFILFSRKGSDVPVSQFGSYCKCSEPDVEGRGH